MKIIIFILSFAIMFGVFSTGHLTFAQESSSTPTVHATPSLIPTPTPPKPTPPSPIPTPPALDHSAKMPNWVKSLFNFYNKGEISYNDIDNALKFLIQTGVIRKS